MTKRTRYPLQEAADRSGVSLDEIRESVSTGLIPSEDGCATLEDILAVHRAKVPGRDEKSLRVRIAVLQKRLLEMEGMLIRLLQIAGIWKYNRDFTDNDLLQLIIIGQGGITKFGQLRTDRIAHLIDLISILSDRELHRMEIIMKKKAVWVGLYTLLGDIIEAMTGRLEHAQNLDVQRLRLEAGMARNHLESQIKFHLAIHDPDCSTEQLFGKLSVHAGRLSGENTSRTFSIKEAVAGLTASGSTGKCPASG
jgi:hypothetical protein